MTNPAQILTPCELKVFELLGRGMTPREIANELSRSHKTINSHRMSAAAKFGFIGEECLHKLTVAAIRYNSVGV